MSDAWNHSICQDCWDWTHPSGRVPVRIREEFRDEKPETCCYCGNSHNSGIYVREDPRNLQCEGVHP